VGVEIERKFRVRDDAWRDAGDEGTSIRQGYLSLEPERTVRVRLAGDRGTLTVKGRTRGATRAEFEFAIPADEAQALLEGLCLRPLIEKTRYRIAHGAHVFEVDVFAGENEGLVLAEVELDDEDERVELPAWIGEEVTGDPRFYNAQLVREPWREA